MKDIDAKIRKTNSKMISILNHYNICQDWVKEMRKENRKLRTK